jgi:hypothetical protein
MVLWSNTLLGRLSYVISTRSPFKERVFDADVDRPQVQSPAALWDSKPSMASQYSGGQCKRIVELKASLWYIVSLRITPDRCIQWELISILYIYIYISYIYYLIDTYIYDYIYIKPDHQGVASNKACPFLAMSWVVSLELYIHLKL